MWNSKSKICNRVVVSISYNAAKDGFYSYAWTSNWCLHSREWSAARSEFIIIIIIIIKKKKNPQKLKD